MLSIVRKWEVYYYDNSNKCILNFQISDNYINNILQILNKISNKFEVTRIIIEEVVDKNA